MHLQKGTSPAMTDRLLRGGRPGGTPADVLIKDGRIAAIAPSIDAHGAEVEELAGQLVLPAFVDAHCHLDKTLWGGPWVSNTSGTELVRMIENGRIRRAEFGIPNEGHVTALLEQMVTRGTSYVRTHTDIDPEIGLTGVEAVLAAASRLEGKVTVEQVAFPQCGLLINPGTAVLMEEALKAGVGTVGGLDPAGVDRDPVGHLDIVFGLADKHGARVDIHLHDGGSLGAWEFELIIERTQALGLQGRVVISHAFAIGEVAGGQQDRLAEALAEAGVGLTTCAIYNDPVPPVAKLRDAGANIALGNDGIRDLWSPYGNGDMLERAMHLAYRSFFQTDDDIEIALEAATYGGARALGLAGYGLREGASADLVVVDARTPAEAVMARPTRSLVLKAGRVVARDGGLV
jgi:cytosine deaminase